MSAKKKTRTFLLLILAATLAVLSGCKHYRAEVAVNPDGSGTRTVTLTVESGPDDGLSVDSPEFRELFGITAQRGWKPIESEDAENSEKTPRGYRLETEVRALSLWAYQSGDVHVSGSHSRGAADGSLPGNRQQEVQFTNTVSLEREETPEGTVFTYRETFAWTGLLKVFVRFYARNLDEDLASGFPDLSAEQRAELRGLLSGMLTTWLMQMEVGKDPEVEIEDLERSFVALARETIRPNHPDLELDRLRVLLGTLFDDTEDELDKHLERYYPGAHETVFSDVDVRVSLPGRIVDSNADELDGNTASWTVGLWDAIARPAEITVKSVMTP